MVQEIQGYERQIFELLRLKGGCVVGFNILRKMRPGEKIFHSTALSKALTKLENDKKISITKTRVGKHEQNQYCIIETKIDEAWQKIHEKHFKSTERSLKNPDLTDDERVFLTNNYVKQAFYLHDVFRLILLSPDVFDIDEKRIVGIKLVNERFLKEIQYKINKLPIEQKRRLVNSLNPTEPKLFSLNEYREIVHEDTPEEEHQKEIAMEAEKERSFQEEPFCIYCSHNSKNYKESEKHEETHLKNFQKNTIQSVKAFEGFYCPRCGKLVGNFDKMEKHKCKTKPKKAPVKN